MGGTPLQRRRVRLLALAAASAGAFSPAGIARAADEAAFPARPLRLVCPWPPGGIADVRSRQIAEHLTRALGQPVVVENRPGAGGTVGATVASQARPDGHTMLLGSINELAIAPALDPRAHEKLISALDPVVFVARGPLLLVASPSLGVNSVAELVALARAKPGQLGYGSAGPQTVHHFAGELLQRAAGIELLHVPYKGASQILLDLVAGHLPVGFDFVATSEPLVKAGKLKVLAVLGPRRVAVLPDAPTAREAGIPSVEAYSWSGVLVPAGTPAGVVSRLNAEITRALRQPDLVASYAASGGELDPGTPEAFGAFLRDEQARWSRRARELGFVK